MTEGAGFVVGFLAVAASVAGITAMAVGIRLLRRAVRGRL